MGRDVASSYPPPGAPASLGMTQGEGENGCVKNSSLPGKLLRAIRPALFGVIKSMTLPGPDKVVRIVDLGCSSSMSSIATVEAVIEQVRGRYREEGMDDSELEIQVFFQDVPTNDFNTLFQLLFSQPNSDDEKVQNYMSAAVPGSFYDRLFPHSTIDIALSSSALHWLSKVPDAVRDKQSPAYNGGHTDIHRSSLATVKAYAEQADKDLDNFLAARAREVAPGGIIFLTFGIRQTETFPYKWDPAFHLQEEVWNTLVLEGSVSEELRDSYNVAHYCRTSGEVNKQLENYSSVFEVQKKQLVPFAYDNQGTLDPKEIARTRVMVNRETCAASLEAYFGQAATNMLFERWEQALCDLFTKWKSDTDLVGDYKSMSMLALALRRR